MIFRYPKIVCSRQGISFQWWHGWFNHGWHSWPVAWVGLWFKPRLKFFSKSGKVPRPPFWTSRVARKFRRSWHSLGLPCPFCRLERGVWR